MLFPLLHFQIHKHEHLPGNQKHEQVQVCGLLTFCIPNYV